MLDLSKIKPGDIVKVTSLDSVRFLVIPHCVWRTSSGHSLDTLRIQTKALDYYPGIGVGSFFQLEEWQIASWSPNTYR